ncbi:DNA topoisomerase 2-alpha-like isoform X3 [Zophobas morio]
MEVDYEEFKENRILNGRDNIPVKALDEIYQKKTQREHVLLRPDSYIGSTEKITENQWVVEKHEMVYKSITYVPGLYKIFDEILVNAADNKQRDPSMNKLVICIDRTSNRIEIWNNGKGLPIRILQKEKMYVPELVFGHLLTSSNYNDEEKKVTGGRNGFGAKLCNIFSTLFVVETADKETGLLFRQEFRNNMTERSTPRVTRNHGVKEYTSICFTPDFGRFRMEGLDEDIIALFTKRAYDMAGVLEDVRVVLNGERIPISGFQSYIKLFLTKQDKSVPILYERVNNRWEVGITHSDGQFQQNSFVNAIATTKGGTHVTHACEKIVSNIVEIVAKKNKAAPVKPTQIKNYLWVFVNCRIENPSFSSQTKEHMTLGPAAFGSKCDLSDKFIKAVIHSGVIDKLLEWAKFKQASELRKQCSGNKGARLTGIPKLDDANKAGTRLSHQCTLILTEGDSAKTLAVSGLSVVGRDFYGVFPLKGKLLNVREATHKQIMGNSEIQNIVKIVGLKYNYVYRDISSLRYGSLMIMTDQDHDGSHIKGLIINFVHYFWPSLLKIPGFLVEFITPIVKVKKGHVCIPFYTIPEYQEWKSRTNTDGWDIKYYKGLGTSTPAEAKEYFQNLRKHKISFSWSSPGDNDKIELAFSKKKADDRKEWLGSFIPGTFLDQNVDFITYTDFIDKELVLFSMADNMRSIPSVMDGLKPGQRKVLFACFKRNLKKEIKVSQLAGYVAEHSAYHHGEASLCATIVSMAQNFVGSNNLNLLLPIGSFGSRLMGGKDASSPRYIHTALSPLARLLFPAADDNILNLLDDDGQSIEPEWYCPIVPMLLVNGCEGIGTGWRTSIPNYNVSDIISNIYRLLDGKAPTPMKPYYHGFEGVVEECEDSYKTFGRVKILDSNTLQIIELPIRTWTSSYKEFLDAVLTSDSPFVKDFKEYHTDTEVNFLLTVDANIIDEAHQGLIHKKLKLESQFSKNNLVAFDPHGKIKKYENANAILQEFFEVRLEFYKKRKAYLVEVYTREHERLSNKVRFVKAIISGDIILNNKPKKHLLEELNLKNYKKFNTKESEDNSGYNYLLSMPLWNLTAEKVQNLEDTMRQKTEELMLLIETSVNQLWRNDLAEFKAMYDELYSGRASETSSSSKGKHRLGGRKCNAKFSVPREQPGVEVPVPGNFTGKDGQQPNHRSKPPAFEVLPQTPLQKNNEKGLKKADLPVDLTSGFYDFEDSRGGSLLSSEAAKPLNLRKTVKSSNIPRKSPFSSAISENSL